jgi:hypothetical protein
MKGKAVRFIVLVFVLGLTAAGTAGATAPTVTDVNVDRTIPVPAGAACSFPITIHNVGIRRTTTFFDSSGNVTRTTVVLIGFTQTVTNDLNGASLSTPLAGPAIVEPNGDGTVTTRVPGNDGRIVVPGTGFVYGDVGLIVFSAPEASPFTQLDVLMLTGHYESPDLYLDALCAALS